MTASEPTTLPDLTPFPSQRLPHLVDLLPDAVWVFDQRDRLTGWNRAAGRLYGLPADAAVGQSVRLFVPHDGLPAFARACEAVRRGEAWAGDLPTRTATGEPRLVHARWVAAGPADNPASSVMAVLTDVTDRRRREAAAVQSARWAATRALAVAVANEDDGRHEEWSAEVRRFARGPDPVAAPEFRGTGDGVLVAAASPVVRELTRACLEAAGYAPVTAADRVEATRVAAGFPGLRAAVLALGPANDDATTDLRRFRTGLPVVALEPSAEPDRLIEAVAEAVAAERLAEASR